MKGTQGGFQMSSGNGIGKLDVLDSTGAVTISLLNNVDNRLVGVNNADFSFYTNNTEKMRITAGGDFGVGVSVPTARGHFSTGQPAEDLPILALQNSSGTFNIYGSSGSPEGVITGSFGDIASDVGSGKIFAKSTSSGSAGWLSMATMEAGSGSANEVAFFNSTGSITSDPALSFLSGQLGIGTISPVAALDVATGQVAFHDGTVSAPGLALRDDLSTGIFSPASGSISITTNATTRATVNGSGEIGLNASPVAGVALRVQEAGSSDIGFELVRVSSTSIAAQSFDRALSTYGDLLLDGLALKFRPSGIEKAIIDDTGVKVIDGLANSPSYSFISDDKTGIFKSSPSELGVTSNGVSTATFAPSAVVIGPSFGATDSVVLNGLVDISARVRIGHTEIDTQAPFVSFAHQSQSDGPAKPLTYLISSIYADDREAIRLYSDARTIGEDHDAILQLTIGANSTASDLSWDFDVPDTDPNIHNRQALRAAMTSGTLTVDSHNNSDGYPWADGAWGARLLSISRSSIRSSVILNTDGGIGRATAGNLDIGNSSNVANVNIATASSTGGVIIGKPNSNVSIVGMVRLSGSRATKTSDLSRTTTVVSADPDLFINAPSPGTYNFRLVAFFNIPASPDGIRFNVGVTAGMMTTNFIEQIVQESAFPVIPVRVRNETVAVSITTARSTDNVAGTGAIMLDGSVTLSAACAFEFRWGNIAAGTGPVTIMSKSYIELIRAA
jgi:hypothetical protein